MSLLLGSVLILWLGLAGSDPILLHDVDGRKLGDLRDSPHRASVLFFVTHDCPISNQYAPEIQRICGEYGALGFECYLVYVDPDLTPARIRSHVDDFGHQAPAILDRDHRLVRAAGATITPEVAVFSSQGEILYRGRINNFYERLGKPRRVVTEHDLRNALDQIHVGQAVSPDRTAAVGCYVPTRRIATP